MSGISGHMMHPHEDLNLSRSNYQNLIRRICMGITGTEKVDGFGLQVCVIGKEVRLVRSKTDLVNQGVAYNDIDQRMAHNPNAAKLYKTAVFEIQRVFSNLSNIPQWPSTINCEVITDGITNVIGYNRGFKVYIHNVWNRENTNSDHYITNEFVKSVEKVHDSVVQSTPQITTKELVNYEYVMLLNMFENVWPIQLHTVRDFYVYEIMNCLGLQKDLATDCINYIFKCNNKNLRELKKKYGEETFSKEKLKQIYSFATYHLDRLDLCIGEVLISAIDPSEKREDIQKYIDLAFEKGMISENDYDKQMRRWMFTGYKYHSIEGIVIDSKYKFTGSFGPLNKLLGYIKRNNSL